jgi:EmrB/QacA subfamily drug resistance transporter
VSVIVNQDTKLTFRNRLGLVILLTGIFMTVLDVYIVNVAIPSIRQSLHATYGEVEFVIAGYLLTVSMGLITAGRLGDLYGRRRVFLVGLYGFVVTSALCGVAPTATSLIVARLLQGFAAAVLSPQVIAIMRVTFVDARQRAVAFSLIGVTIGVASVIGQVLGAVIIDADVYGLSWRPIFLLNVPVGLIAAAAAPFALDESHATITHRMDLLGASLITCGLGLLLYPLVRGHEAHWPTSYLTMMLLSIVVIAAFIGHQVWLSLRGRAPLLDIRLFRDRAFSVGCILIFLFYSTLTSFALMITILLQVGLDFSPVRAGLEFSFLAVAFAITSFVTGRLSVRNPRAVLYAGAIVCTTGGILLIAAAEVGLPAGWGLLPGLVALGIGDGLFMTPCLNFVVSHVHDNHVGMASGVLTTMQRVGGAFGVAVLGLLFFSARDRALAGGAGRPEAYTEAFALAAMSVTLATALLLPLVRMMPHSVPRLDK